MHVEAEMHVSWAAHVCSSVSISVGLASCPYWYRNVTWSVMLCRAACAGSESGGSLLYWTSAACACWASVRAPVTQVEPELPQQCQPCWANHIAPGQVVGSQRSSGHGCDAAAQLVYIWAGGVQVRTFRLARRIPHRLLQRASFCTIPSAPWMFPCKCLQACHENSRSIQKLTTAQSDMPS